MIDKEKLIALLDMETGFHVDHQSPWLIRLACRICGKRTPEQAVLWELAFFRMMAEDLDEEVQDGTP